MGFLKKLFGKKQGGGESESPATENEYVKWLAEWTVALKLQDKEKLVSLLKKNVPCNFCDAVVHAADAYRAGGNFICPKCGKAWFVVS